MRINVYSQELTNEVQAEEKRSNTGLVYSAVRLILHSSPMLHHPPRDILAAKIQALSGRTGHDFRENGCCCARSPTGNGVGLMTRLLTVARHITWDDVGSGLIVAVAFVAMVAL